MLFYNPTRDMESISFWGAIVGAVVLPVVGVYVAGALAMIPRLWQDRQWRKENERFLRG